MSVLQIVIPKRFSVVASLLLSRLVLFSVHGAAGTGSGFGPSFTQGGRNVVLCVPFEALASFSLPGIGLVNTLVF